MRNEDRMTLNIDDDPRYVRLDVAGAGEATTMPPDQPTYEVVSAVMSRLLRHPEELPRPVGA